MGRIGAVRGNLLRWAREEQDLTMRRIDSNEGPSPAYQSEVENGKKHEVLSDMLATWTKLLNVTEAFARGQIGKYHLNPANCAGLAADIGALVITGRSDLPTWNALNEQERVRAVLRLIAGESRQLPRVVLAWVLDLHLSTLDAVLVGQHPVMQTHMKAVAQLTMLPESFFTDGPADQLANYLPVLRRAIELGISPEALLKLMGPDSGGPSGHRACRVHVDGPFGSGRGTRDAGEEHRQDQQQSD